MEKKRFNLNDDIKTLVCKPYDIDRWQIKGNQILYLDDGTFNIQKDYYYKVSFKNVNSKVGRYLTTACKNSDVLYIDSVGMRTNAVLKYDHGEIKLEITFDKNADGYLGR